jgi:hypothetical protein
MALTIQGQLGKALDASLRTPSLLKIRDLSLRVETLADDTLTWTARTQDLLGTMTILPDVEQTVSLYDDSVRIFHGHVSDPRDIPYGTRVTVAGPWWWLRRIQLTSTGTAGDRPQIELPSATVKANLTTLLNRAIAKGAPIRIGTIADTLSVPLQRLAEMNFAEAIADQLRWIADGVAWWDYSGTGFPAFNLTRRAGALDTTYALGNSAGQVSDFDLSPQTEHQATRVELSYMVRGSGGVPAQAMQASGTAAAGRTQTIAISGPERDTFVPADNYASATVQTTAANATVSTLEPHILNILPEVLTSRAAYPGSPSTSDVILANGESLATNSAIGGGGGTNYSTVMPTLQWLNPTTGLPVSVVGKNLVLTANPPDWLTLAGSERVKLTGRIYAISPVVTYKSPYGPSDSADPSALPAWASAFGWSATIPLPGYTASTSFAQPFPYDRYRVNVLALDFEIEVLLTTASYPSATVINRPQAFDYLAPPAGMAAALLGMQTWTPWRGQIVRKGAAYDPSALRRRYNLSGARPVHATMGALPKALAYDFRSRTATLELGAPTRHDAGSLAQRFRQPATTNITINNV